MPTQETNTAADRLFRIINGVYVRQNSNLLNIWSEVLNVPSKDKLELFRQILSVAALVDEIENTIRSHGGSGAKFYIRGLDQVRHALMVNVDNHRSVLNNILKPEVMTDLEHCAAKYSELDKEIPIAAEEVGTIKTRVDELFEDISRSNHLATELRQKLLDLLEVIRQQISQFQIRGATALQECLRQSLARLMEIYPSVQEQREESLLKRVISVVTDISTLCEKAQKALPLLKYVGKIIPLLASGNGHAATPEIMDAEILSGEPK
jgi:chromosome segregation ATPase